MQDTLTIISSLENACVYNSLITSLEKQFGTQHIELYPEVAYDFELPEDVTRDESVQFVINKIGDLPIDIVVQPSRNRRKKLFLADMDSTIIGQECIDELAAEIGVKEQVSHITEAAMNGEIDFEDALKDRVALLAGLKDDIVSKVLKERISINKGAKEALAVMRANGTHTALVSGGFTVFASVIAGAVGFREYHANELLTENGMFSGKVAEPILGQQAKLDQLNRLASQRNIDLMDTIAIGDGANDLPMLMNAGTGVAYYAKPTVAAQADIKINHADLTALLFIQGYVKSDIDGALS